MPQEAHRGRFLLIYGSQTGQAKAIAEEVAETASQHGLHADLHCLSMTEKRFWLEREKLAVIITSTTGDGEAPDTAQKFWRRLKKRTLPDNHLDQLSYALLGLGDSNYTNFCSCGHMFDRRLEVLGASRFLPSAWGDDAVGLEVAVEPWIDSLWPVLRQHLGLPPEVVVNGNGDLHPMTNGHNSSMEEDSSVVRTAQVVAGDVPVVSTEVQANSGVNSETRSDSGRVGSTSISANQRRTEENSLESVPSSEQTAQMCSESESDSLTHSLPPLSESSLTLPLCPAPYLDVEYHDRDYLDLASVLPQNGCPFPSAKSAVHHAPTLSCQKLTADSAVKTALCMRLDLSGCAWRPEPGDSFSIVCPNSDEEVNDLLLRLNLSDAADVVCTLHMKPDTKRKKAAVPEHYPPLCTLRHLLTTCCDIRAVPKKAFLRALVDHTSDLKQKRRLQELCSKQGMTHYSTYIREQSVCLVDILAAFPSCTPPVECVLEHLPRLQPRPYSAASSPLATANETQFVFNVIEIPAGQGRVKARQGVCTGWLLHSLTSSGGRQAVDSVQCSMDTLSITDGADMKIPVFLRSNQHFRPPTDLSTPIVMIGPGTGVAPFIGFLQHREVQRRQADCTAVVGASWLLFGCRHRHRDFLFKTDLDDFVSTGTLSRLLVSFSRDQDQDSGSPQYVQDSMRLHGDDLVDMLEVKKACVYICGDARNMARNVLETFVELLQKHRGMEKNAAEAYMMELRRDKRYLEDVWT